MLTRHGHTGHTARVRQPHGGQTGARMRTASGLDDTGARMRAPVTLPPRTPPRAGHAGSAPGATQTRGEARGWSGGSRRRGVLPETPRLGPEVTRERQRRRCPGRWTWRAPACALARG